MREDIVSQMNLFMVEKLEYPEQRLSPLARLREELGMTSLEMIETTLFIERTFGFRPQRNEIKYIATLENLYDYIENHLSQGVD